MVELDPEKADEDESRRARSHVTVPINRPSSSRAEPGRMLPPRRCLPRTRSRAVLALALNESAAQLAVRALSVAAVAVRVKAKG